MKKNKFNKLISIFLIFISISLFPYKGNAATLNELYKTNINVKLTRLGTINNFQFTVDKDYSVSNSEVILKPDSNYEVSIANGILTLKENGNVLASINQDFSITPSTTEALIKVTNKNLSYRGSMKFKIDSNTGFFVINSLNIEDYLVGVVPYEMSDSWGDEQNNGMEALMAQAVAARTYALSHKKSGDYDVNDDTSSQVYNGYNSANIYSIKAINSTKGQVLTYNGQLIDALYCASNGGWIEDTGNIWTTSYPYITVKQDLFDAQTPSHKYYSTVTTYTDCQIENLIRQQYPKWNLKQLIKIDVDNITRTSSGRINELPIIYLDNNNATITEKLVKSSVSSLLSLKSTLSTVTYHPKGVLAEFSKYIGDSDRYGTAISIANTAFNPSSSNKLQNVVLATGRNFPDALSGAVLAKKNNAPILLVDSDVNSTGSSKTINYINNYLDKNGTIFILGGTGVVPEDFATKFKQLGFSNLTRLAGFSRIDTSAAINDKIAPAINTSVVIATANNFPDALSISPIAAAKGWPIYLVDNTLPDSLKAYLQNNKPSNVYVIGGTGVVSESLRSQVKTILGYGDDKVVRLGGASRYETSKNINSYFINKTDKVLLATGRTFPDALSGSVYAGINNYPIILADSNDSENATTYIKNISYNSPCMSLETLGLSGAVSENVISSITSALKFSYTINTKGYGHGAGMSQWGAYYRAKSGKPFSEILDFYYPGTTKETLQ